MHRQSASQTDNPSSDLAHRLMSSFQARGEPVELLETHISWIFLTAELAYKVKKPLKNPFLDYSTLELRQRLCEEELRLDRRYAADLYVDVVPVTAAGRQLYFGGTGKIVDFAVCMRRFPPESLLLDRVRAGRVDFEHMQRLAQALADFHAAAQSAATTSEFGTPAQVGQDALDNISALREMLPVERCERWWDWTHQELQRLSLCFQERRQRGHIRECHGDLHAGNIVWWQGKFIPFDGIEFNDRFRWIDVINDTAFLAMDLQALEQPQLAAIFISSYCERSGDYAALPLLRWYLVYRALVRAKVAGMASQQHAAAEPAFAEAQADLLQHAQLADRLIQTATRPPQLWIMHGLSGSGKSTVAQHIVVQQALAGRSAIRLRSDVERKRLRGLRGEFRPDQQQASQLYSSEMTAHTYRHLCDVARQVLAAGWGVVVDAAFLKADQRQLFAQLAQELQIEFHIVDCNAPLDDLLHRLAQRQALGGDPSDADASTLELQLTHQDSFSALEQLHVISAESITAESITGEARR